MRQFCGVIVINFLLLPNMTLPIGEIGRFADVPDPNKFSVNVLDLLYVKI